MLKTYLIYIEFRNIPDCSDTGSRFDQQYIVHYDKDEGCSNLLTVRITLKYQLSNIFSYIILITYNSILPYCFKVIKTILSFNKVLFLRWNYHTIITSILPYCFKVIKTILSYPLIKYYSSDETTISSAYSKIIISYLNDTVTHGNQFCIGIDNHL